MVSLEAEARPPDGPGTTAGGCQVGTGVTEWSWRIEETQLLLENAVHSPEGEKSPGFSQSPILQTPDTTSCWLDLDRCKLGNRACRTGMRTDPTPSSFVQLFH